MTHIHPGTQVITDALAEALTLSIQHERHGFGMNRHYVNTLNLIKLINVMNATGQGWHDAGLDTLRSIVAPMFDDTDPTYRHALEVEMEMRFLVGVLTDAARANCMPELLDGSDPGNSQDEWFQAVKAEIAYVAEEVFDLNRLGDALNRLGDDSYPEVPGHCTVHQADWFSGQKRCDGSPRKGINICQQPDNIG